MKQIRNLILIIAMSGLSAISIAESKEKDSVRVPAQTNWSNTVEALGEFSNGSKVERFKAIGANIIQIIDQKAKVICYATPAGISCAPMYSN